MTRRQYFTRELCQYDEDACSYAFHHSIAGNTYHLMSYMYEHFDIGLCLHCRNKLYTYKTRNEGPARKYSYFQPTAGSVFHIQFDDENTPMCNRVLPRELISIRKLECDSCGKMTPERSLTSFSVETNSGYSEYEINVCKSCLERNSSGK